MAPSFRLKKLSWAILSFLLLSLLVLIVLHLLFPIYPLLERVQFSKVYYDRNGQLLGARLSPDEKWRFQSHLDEIAPELTTALLLFEDKRYYDHWGVDPLAIVRAIGQNVQARRVVSGASTISMQVARLLGEERHYRSFWGKLVQTFRAFQLESTLSKNEILEWYFNLAPYGGNIEGVVAASWFYFAKPPSQLTWTEAIALAITPKSPNVYRPDQFPLLAQKHCHHLRKRLEETGHLASIDLWFIECQQPPGDLRRLPRHAPHFVDRLHTGSGQQSALVLQETPALVPTWNHIRTTLDLDIQLHLEHLVSGYMKTVRASGIHNAAVMVLENHTSEIVAYIGSSNFSDKKHAGEVDGVRAWRSPGSTLKPFIYARALESGQYNSHTLLANVPIAYPGYRPQNYTPEDLGIAHFDDALIQSLNLPAVSLNVALGRDRDLMASLWAAEVSTLPHNRDHYGQSLVLGGGEMRLDELGVLYTALARKGELRPAHMVLKKQRGGPALRVGKVTPWITPEAAFIVSEILKESPHPRYGTAAYYLKDMPHVAWKTGTSSRQRDAWTIGYTPIYTVAVWVGNFSGVRADGMSGGRSAAPLFFEIIRELSRFRSTTWPNPPEDVIQQSVCSLSGGFANAFCPAEESAWWIVGVTEPTFCQMHIELLTHRATGDRLSPECIYQQDIPVTDIESRPAILWPRETGGWLARNQSAVIFPPYADGCAPAETLQQQPPILHTPLHGEKYLIRSGDNAAPFARFEKIAFSAAVSNEVHQLDWYLDGQKIASTSPGDPYLWTPTPGNHELILVDNFGRATQAQFTVYVDK